MKISRIFLIFISSIIISRGDHHIINLNRYNNFETIVDYLLKLTKEYPTKVNATRIGFSHEGRPIPLVKIYMDKINEDERTNPIILIDACTHAREWITTAVALHLIHQLVTNEKHEDLLRHVDWYIIPVLNPDGYEYSITTDRKWRKNRAEGDTCNGVDLNRNFGFHWGEIPVGECAPTYAGPRPFSEPETRALKRIVLYNQKRIKLYISLHSYGELITYPWGYKDKKVSKDFEELSHDLGSLVAEAINSVRGTHYKAGRQSSTLYKASGLSIDWMVGVANISMAYIIEMSNKTIKFTPPATEILPTSIEIFEGLKIFHKFVNDIYWNASETINEIQQYPANIKMRRSNRKRYFRYT